MSESGAVSRPAINSAEYQRRLYTDEHRPVMEHGLTNRLSYYSLYMYMHSLNYTR